MVFPRSSVQLAALCLGLFCSLIYFFGSGSNIVYAPTSLKNPIPGNSLPSSTLQNDTFLTLDSHPAASDDFPAVAIDEPANDPIWDIKNATLGFQKIYAISMPSRTDKRDYLALMGLVSGLNIEFADGVNGSDMHPRSFPSVRLSNPLSQRSY
jgi:hypothetical protein